MRARINKNVGVVGTVAIALAVITLYSLWGATVLTTEAHAQADSHVRVATTQI